MLMIDNKDTISTLIEHLSGIPYVDHTAGFSVSYFPP